MKTKKFLLLFLSLLFLGTSCKTKPTQEPENPNDAKDMLFHVWVPISDGGAMGGSNFIVHSLSDLTSGTIDPKGSGIDVSEKLNSYFVVKGKNYYTINKAGQFAKYDSKFNELKKIPMPTIQERKFAHTWMDDKTLVLAGSNGEGDAINWVKIDVQAMKLTGQGTFELDKPAEGMRLNSSGMIAYRKQDNKLMYSYEYKKQGRTTQSAYHRFHLAFIDGKSMKVEKVVTENRADFMAATAFGELRQEKSFMTKNGDYYLACNTTLDGASSYTQQYGSLFRVKAGEMDFDKSYNGYPEQRGKIVTINNLFNGKALLYMQDPVFSNPSNPAWDHKKNPYVFYWIVLDLETGEYEHLKDIPFSAGNFSQLAVVYRDKAYIGTNASDGTTKIYIYDIKTGKVSGGANLAEGHQVERLVLLENE